MSTKLFWFSQVGWAAVAVISLQLAFNHFAKREDACLLSSGDCNAVLQSSFSHVLNIPVSAFVAFAAVLMLWFGLKRVEGNGNHWVPTAICFCFIIGSIVLQSISFFVLRQVCSWCVLIAVVGSSASLICLTQKFAPVLISRRHFKFGYAMLALASIGLQFLLPKGLPLPRLNISEGQSWLLRSALSRFGNGEQSGVVVFFRPDCPACADEILALINSGFSSNARNLVPLWVGDDAMVPGANVRRTEFASYLWRSGRLAELHQWMQSWAEGTFSETPANGNSFFIPDREEFLSRSLVSDSLSRSIKVRQTPAWIWVPHQGPARSISQKRAFRILQLPLRAFD